MDLAAKYAEFPHGNTNPTKLDKRIVAILREVDQLRLDIRAATPGDPDFEMHDNLPCEVANLGVTLDWLLRDYRAFWMKAPSPEQSEG